MTRCMRPKWNVRSPQRQRLARNSGLSSVRRGSSATRTSSALRLLPCDVFARVAFVGAGGVPALRSRSHGGSPRTEARSQSLDTRVEPRVYRARRVRLHAVAVLRTVGHRSLRQPSYAKALEGLHAGMAQLDVVAPHFSDRRHAKPSGSSRSRERTPRLEDADRELLSSRRCGAAAAGSSERSAR